MNGITTGMHLNPVDILFEHYPAVGPLALTLVQHSEQVRDMALEVAENIPHLEPDIRFIAEAAMLHDIGIYRTAANRIGCRGTEPYIRHGIIGRQILESYGLTAHALVCERHVGVGISKHDILEQGLPLPLRDMLPVTIEEQIICYADKFFSKKHIGETRSLEAVIAELKAFGPQKVDRFMQWHRLFGS